LLSMHSAQCKPHGSRVVLLALNMRLLGDREVCKDLAGGLLLVHLKAIESLSILHLNLGVHSVLGVREIINSAISLLRILDKCLLTSCKQCVNVANNTKLTKASSHLTLPRGVVELSELGNILGGRHGDG
jgi:hypothetical protein